VYTVGLDAATARIIIGKKMAFCLNIPARVVNACNGEWLLKNSFAPKSQK